MTQKPPLTLHRTAPQQERKARDEARRAGVKAYVPQETRYRRRHANSKAKAVPYQAPIAPGYIATAGHVRDAFYIRQTIGKMKRGSLSALYRAARDEVLSQRAAKRKSKEPPKFDRGEPVIITKGAFENIPAVVMAVKGSVATLSVEIFGRGAFPVKVSVRDIKRAKATVAEKSQRKSEKSSTVKA